MVFDARICYRHGSDPQSISQENDNPSIHCSRGILCTTISTYSTEEIKDKGKNDWLAKSLVLLQTLWFVLQRIGRTIEYLPAAHLEIMTLGYATMNFVVYMVEQAREHLSQLQDLAPGQRTDF